MSYEKQIWNQYDDLKTEEENIENGAVVTDNRMNHIEEGIEDHTSDVKNPHGVTAAQVGLGNVQNFGLATEDEAKQGTSNAKYMTPSLTQAVLSANINSIAYANSADGTDGFTTVYPNLNLLTGTSTKVVQATVWNMQVANIKYDKSLGEALCASVMINNADHASVLVQGSAKIVLETLDQSGNVLATIDGNDVSYNASGLSWCSISINDNTASARAFIFTNNMNKNAFYSCLKIEPGSTATPWMPSVSEVTTADWPKYVGFSNTVKTNKSASDYTWFPVKDPELTNKANDSEVVHKTGDETISGSKSFEEIKINGKTIIDLLHPVGSYYITNDSTDPSKIFGIGTWVRVKGRVLVGVDEDDDALLSPNKTGGSVNPLTSHTHDYNRSGANAITSGGTPSVANQIAAVTSGGYWGSASAAQLQSSGSNTNHANWQPFQTAYIWYRSA